MLTMHRKQQGAILAYAILVLVVLAALSAFLANISLTQQQDVMLDIEEARAYQAARAGTEWGLYQALQSPPTATPCAATTNLSNINGFTVTVTCSVGAAATSEVGMGTIYNISATACNNPNAGACPGNVSSANYVERRLNVIAETPP